MANRIIIFGVLFLVLTGCALVEDMGIKDQLPVHEKHAEQLNEKIEKKGPKGFEEIDGFYLGAKERPMSEENRLPDFFKTQFTLIEPLYLNGIADRVTRIFKGRGVSVAVAPDVPQQEMTKKVMPINFTGNLKLFLDSVSSYYGLYWRYQDYSIQFYKTLTRHYSLLASMSKIESSAELTNRSEGGGSTGDDGTEQSAQSEQTVKSSMSFSAWEETINTIKNMVGDAGTVTKNQVAGEITVTAAPGMITRVDEYMTQVNKRLARQVAITVTVTSFKDTDQRDRGIGADLSYQDITGAQLKIASGGANQAVDGAGSVSAAIVESIATVPHLKQFYGSQFILNALRDRGKVSVKRRASVIGMNNMPMILHKLDRDTYVAEISSTQGDSGNTTTSNVEQKEVVTGFSLYAVPHVLPDNRIVLEYKLVVAELNGFNDASSDDAEYKLLSPETTDRNNSTTVVVKPGQTIVMAGYAKEKLSDGRKDGTLSYGSSETNDKELIIVTIDINDATITAS